MGVRLLKKNSNSEYVVSDLVVGSGDSRKIKFGLNSNIVMAKKTTDEKT